MPLIGGREFQDIHPARRLGNFNKSRIGGEENKILRSRSAPILQILRVDTNFFDLACRPVLPGEMEKSIFAVGENDSAFRRTGINCICSFSSEGPASFECEEGLSHYM